FYLAVDRLPLSTVGAIEFLGTVILAAAGARTPRNAAALILTTAGVAAITAIRVTGQPLGFVFAFANCALFMLYIVLGHRIANEGGPGAIDRLGAAWHLDEAAAEPIVKAAVDGGVTFFDTADTYSDGVTEQITGRLLSRLFDHRDHYVLATKVFFPMGPGRNDRGLSRKHILAAIDASLRRLGTDYVDLYQIHRWDYETPVEETMATLHDVVKAGKARYIGASSMFAWQFAKAQHVAERNGWTRFVSMQNHYNLMYREEEREMLPLCADQGV